MSPSTAAAARGRHRARAGLAEHSGLSQLERKAELPGVTQHQQQAQAEQPTRRQARGQAAATAGADTQAEKELIFNEPDAEAPAQEAKPKARESPAAAPAGEARKGSRWGNVREKLLAGPKTAQQQDVFSEGTGAGATQEIPPMPSDEEMAKMSPDQREAVRARHKALVAAAGGYGSQAVGRVAGNEARRRQQQDVMSEWTAVVRGQITDQTSGPDATPDKAPDAMRTGGESDEEEDREEESRPYVPSAVEAAPSAAASAMPVEVQHTVMPAFREYHRPTRAGQHAAATTTAAAAAPAHTPAQASATTVQKWQATTQALLRQQGKK